MISVPGKLMGSKGGGAVQIPLLMGFIEGTLISQSPAPQVYTAFALRRSAQKNFVRAVNILAA